MQQIATTNQRPPSRQKSCCYTVRRGGEFARIREQLIISQRRRGCVNLLQYNNTKSPLLPKRLIATVLIIYIMDRQSTVMAVSFVIIEVLSIINNISYIQLLSFVFRGLFMLMSILCFPYTISHHSSSIPRQTEESLVPNYQPTVHYHHLRID